MILYCKNNKAQEKGTHMIQIAGKYGEFIQEAIRLNKDDAEFTFEYAAPGFVFKTEDQQLLDQLTAYAHNHNILV